jgi:hypothetical protein
VIRRYVASACLGDKEVRNWVSVSNSHVTAYQFRTCVCQIPSYHSGPHYQRGVTDQTTVEHSTSETEVTLHRDSTNSLLSEKE